MPPVSYCLTVEDEIAFGLSDRDAGQTVPFHVRRRRERVLTAVMLAGTLLAHCGFWIWSIYFWDKYHTKIRDVLGGPKTIFLVTLAVVGNVVLDCFALALLWNAVKAALQRGKLSKAELAWLRSQFTERDYLIELSSEGVTHRRRYLGQPYRFDGSPMPSYGAVESIADWYTDSYGWSEILRIRTTSDHVFLYHSHEKSPFFGKALIVPKRAFPDQRAFDDFVSTAVKYRQEAIEGVELPDTSIRAKQEGLREKRPP
jgi:hypothetical protein